jgi:hypothetical protein
MRAARIHSFHPRRALVRLLPSGLFLGVLLGGCDRAAEGSGPVSAAVTVADTLALLELHLASAVLDSAVAAEGARLDAACGTVRVPCRAERSRELLLPLDTLRAEPVGGAAVAGVLAARLHVPEHGWHVADLVLLPPEGADEDPAVHVRELGDWGYGIDFAVTTWRDATPEDPPGRWARLPGVGSHAGGWIALDGGGLRGWLTPADDPVWAASLDDGEEGGPVSVRIVRIEDGLVHFREEVPSDMPCGLDVAPDPPAPARFVVPLAALFAADGTPRLRAAYPRGC